MNKPNEDEAIQNDLVYNIYEAFKYAFENNISLTLSGKTLPIKSLFQEPQKIKQLLDLVLEKDNQDPSKRRVIDIFQIKKMIRKIKNSQKLLRAEEKLPEDLLVEDAFTFSAS